MKIRRILATAVAAAVTTPVVFLSAAPAFADTKPTPASTQKTTPGDEDPDFDEYEKLLAAVNEAEEKVEALEEQRKALVTELRNMKLDEALATEASEAAKALVAAEAAKKDADEKLAKAEEALAAATPEQKEAAEKAVADAKTAVEEATATKAAAELRNTKAAEATKPYSDARLALTQKISLLDADLTLARTDLAEAEKALEEFEEGSGECEVEDLKSLKVTLSGPEKVTAGQSASFSLRVTNEAERTLEDVDVAVSAMRLPEPGEVIDEDTDFSKHVIPVEWSSADNLEWTPFTEKFDSIEVGELVKGGHYDVKLRLTLPADAPAGEGTIFSFGSYDKFDGDCGGDEQFAQTKFDILAAKPDKPKPEPKPTPSETTATPTPAPTTGGNGNTTQQGGSSNTPVDGSLAATGANENLTRLGLAAAATVALGAGAVVIARRRKAGTNA
ncbi:hypothetical protein EAO70_28355 [Streptomyces sp. adm13(2018)]|uniref:hypothetical protein n=1 Tax=Streptomyces sp. adm13(2018) TaxID=2479007 RepID=UPI0011CE1B6E|nr:hypothetical protein [Streptomyces sp. adm13(2018)]TXS10924.1 hypothetical protein EAO70_28355 [Streptomyces sp. adm13(2018)]